MTTSRRGTALMPVHDPQGRDTGVRVAVPASWQPRHVYVLDGAAQPTLEAALAIVDAQRDRPHTLRSFVTGWGHSSACDIPGCTIPAARGTRCEWHRLRRSA